MTGDTRSLPSKRATASATRVSPTRDHRETPVVVAQRHRLIAAALFRAEKQVRPPVTDARTRRPTSACAPSADIPAPAGESRGNCEKTLAARIRTSPAPASRVIAISGVVRRSKTTTSREALALAIEVAYPLASELIHPQRLPESRRNAAATFRQTVFSMEKYTKTLQPRKLCRIDM